LFAYLIAAVNLCYCVYMNNYPPPLYAAARGGRKFTIVIFLLALSCQSAEPRPQEKSISLVFPVIVDSYSDESSYLSEVEWEFDSLALRAEIPLDMFSLGVQVTPFAKYNQALTGYAPGQDYSAFEIAPFMRTYLATLPGLFAEIGLILGSGLYDEDDYLRSQSYIHARPAIGYRASTLEGFLIDFSLGYRTYVYDFEIFDAVSDYKFHPYGFDATISFGMSF
jgi:hypothetical protein